MNNSNNFVNATNDDICQSYETDICIVGAGAAGITVARRLAKQKDVILVESGDFDLEGKTQGLYAGRSLALKYFDLLTCRLRYFGGTTNHWGGYCRPNDPIDYEGREEIGLPKWPVNEKELAPYIRQAALELDLNPEFFNNSLIMKDNGLDEELLVDKHAGDIYTKFFQLTEKRRFSSIYKDSLFSQSNLRVFLNLNVVHIQMNTENSHVDHIVCKTLNGKVTKIKARQFVLATHAIENARLLLNSKDVAPNGIGNSSDHVGRYFMEHVHVKASKLIPSDSFPKIYDRNVLKRLKLNANMSLTDDFIREKGIMQYYCRFSPVYTEQDTISSLKGVKNNLNSPFSNELFTDILKVASDLSGALNYSVSKLPFGNAKPKYFQLDHRIEQAPNPESRVVLSTELDELGTPKADLKWTLNSLDYKTFKLGQDKIVNEMSRIGVGRFIVEEMNPELIESRVAGHYHHIGTTRMSYGKEDGVVDKNCKVHDVDNLYVAGSSIFPTAGYSGPTMMILAFSIRLADHLSKIR